MRHGGIIHSYQKYDPRRFPSPTQPPPDVVSSAFEYFMAFGNARELTPEQLARAIRIDPSQISGLGPSLDALIAMLLERKRRILEKYETEAVLEEVREQYQRMCNNVKPPPGFRDHFEDAIRDQHIPRLERLWFSIKNDRSKFARKLMRVIQRLGEKYEVEELDANYDFIGHERMSVPKAIEIKEELDKIEELLKQLQEALETAEIGIIDMDALAEFAEPGDMAKLGALEQQIQDYLREIANRQGLERDGSGYRLTPKAYRLFQGKLLERIFSQLEASRTGRHQGPVTGEGAVETQRTRDYEFGDSITHMDLTQSFTNAVLRAGPGFPVQLTTDDIVVHETRNTPKCATVVVMDMSGSMRYDAQYINVKRMAMALDGLIRSEYPGDFLRFVEMYTFCKNGCSRRNRESVTKTGHNPRSLGATQSGYEPRRCHRISNSSPLHQHSACAEARATASGRAGLSESSSDPNHRWITNCALRERMAVYAISAGYGDRTSDVARSTDLHA